MEQEERSSMTARRGLPRGREVVKSLSKGRGVGCSLEQVARALIPIEPALKDTDGEDQPQRAYSHCEAR
jgi:hypothetical protein